MPGRQERALRKEDHSYAFVDETYLAVCDHAAIHVHRFASRPGAGAGPDPALTLPCPPGTTALAMRRDNRRTSFPRAPFQPDPALGTLLVSGERTAGREGFALLVTVQRIRALLASPVPGTWTRAGVLVLDTAGAFDPASPPPPHGTRFALLARGGDAVVYDLNPTLAEAARRCGSKAGGAAHTVVRVPDAALAKARQGAMVMVNCHGQPLLVPVSSVAMLAARAVRCLTGFAPHQSPP